MGNLKSERVRVVEHLTYVIHGIAGLCALAVFVGIFKAIDWLISLKYQTKDKCEDCRKEIFNTINIDRNLLIEVNTKVSIILKHIENKIKEGE